MPHAWLPGNPGDDDLESLFAASREAWRGELHRDDQSWGADAADEAWRGSEHLRDWPESSAGPEYWMYKQAASGDNEPT